MAKETEPDTSVVHARVPAAVAEALRREAKVQRRTISNLVALILEDWAAQQDGPGKPAQRG